MNTDSRLQQFEQALLSMNKKDAARILSDGNSAASIRRIEELIVPALEDIGRGWEEGTIALSQVYMSGRLCEQLMSNVASELTEPERQVTLTIALAALDDYHLLGLRLVSSVLGASCIPFLNWGRMDADSMIRKVGEEKVDVLLVSVLMLRSALHIREVRAALDAQGSAVKIIVGGAPFRLDRELWKEVGADATADTAAGAIPLIHRFESEAHR